MHEARASPVILRRKTSLALGNEVLPFPGFFFSMQMRAAVLVENVHKIHDRQAWSGDELVSSRAEKESDDCSSISFPLPCL